MLEGYIEEVILHLRRLKEIDNVKLLVDEIASSPHSKIFTYGVGRSGYIAQAFTMRLMHLGFNAYFVGEPNCPAAEEGDILVVISGSGRTYSVVNMVKRIRREGRSIKIVSIGGVGEIGKMSDIHIELDVGEYNREYFPMGTLFEELAFILLDGVIYLLKERLNISEEEMKRRHCNLL
ncbi:MAG TPA: SIS domain-containing protein [Methanothermococcus okinawensis]|uniref:SIS domain-containing protein n=1 Tax=Methanothermococcus okinawensis TaxID=155863 RepID=A0A833E1K1_9EURY|nr:SIS domain-containing protein [Methanococcaceae archaeon]HIP84201.1 SIS domain-containing protein [Methanothermococcus okinawensis]HIP90995.1 SIS domain-containing protein [Methanothermococcus okinawensis]